MNLLTHLHPAIVHFPIALLLLGSVTALVHLYRPALFVRWLDLRRTTWFLLGVGWIAVVPAVLSGLLAQSPLPPDASYRLTLNWHTATGLGLLVQASMLFVALLIFMLLQPILTAAPFILTDFAVILLMGMICFIPFVIFVRGVASGGEPSSV